MTRNRPSPSVVKDLTACSPFRTSNSMSFSGAEFGVSLRIGPGRLGLNTITPSMPDASAFGEGVCAMRNCKEQKISRANAAGMRCRLFISGRVNDQKASLADSSPQATFKTDETATSTRKRSLNRPSASIADGKPDVAVASAVSADTARPNAYARLIDDLQAHLPRSTGDDLETCFVVS